PGVDDHARGAADGERPLAALDPRATRGSGIAFFHHRAPSSGLLRCRKASSRARPSSMLISLRSICCRMRSRSSVGGVAARPELAVAALALPAVTLAAPLPAVIVSEPLMEASRTS